MIEIIRHKMQAMVPASLSHLGLIMALWCVIAGAQLCMNFAIYADYDLSVADNLKRVQLVKQVIRTPDIIENLVQNDIRILLREPAINRNEIAVNAWHYHGESCALDIYFKSSTEASPRPHYVEFRTLSMNNDVNAQFKSIDDSAMRNYCLRDVLDAQGVNTPDSYARQPTPSWDNPYRT